VISPDPRREATFQAIISALRSRAPLLHNVWAVLGRGVPRSIDDLATVLWAPEKPPEEARFRQQRAGAFIAHLNKRIASHGVIIKPGAARGTYQLYDTATWESDQKQLRDALKRQAAGEPPPLVTRRARKNRP
jgi:hypothetical protein